jgi:hypothetical protein
MLLALEHNQLMLVLKLFLATCVHAQPPGAAVLVCKLSLLLLAPQQFRTASAQT